MHEGRSVRSVVLCADEESLRSPELIGLAGESLEAQRWLSVCSSGADARARLRDCDAACEAWVVSSSDVDAINLAAALKRDRRDRTVVLVSAEVSGSLRSRAGCAGIDAVVGTGALAARYAEAKRAAQQGSAAWQEEGRPAEGSAVAGRAPADPASATASSPAPAPAACAPPPAPAAFESRPMGAVAAGEGLRSASPASVERSGEAIGSSSLVMPVVSGSGGAGKSTVSVLAALIAQRAGFKTALVDFDLQFGDVLALLGRDDALRVDEALAAPASLARIRPDGPLPAVLGAPRRLEQGEEVASRVGELVDRLKAEFEVVVANTGSFWAEQHAALLERSAGALFLIDQRPSSLRSCRHALELCARCGIATGPFVFAVNRCSRSALYTSLDVSCALRGAHAVELAEGGRDVEELMAAGQPLELVEDGNPLCESIEDVLAGVIPGWEARVGSSEPAAPRFRGLFGRKRKGGRAACL